MIYDIVVLALMVIPAAIGIYRGFFNMFVRMTGWIVAIAAGFFLKDTVAGFLGGSIVGETIRQRISEKFAASSQTVVTAVEGLPEIIRGGITTSAEAASETLAGMFSDMLISIVGFAAVVFGVWFVLRILVGPANKRKNGGILNTTDKMMGFTFGFLEGVMLAFVFMTVLLAVLNFADAKMTEQILTDLAESYLAGTLYDNNLLLLITGGLFSQ